MVIYQSDITVTDDLRYVGIYRYTDFRIRSTHIFKIKENLIRQIGRILGLDPVPFS